ncbi:hypothetical protein [Streptomyces sp. NPDC001970]
MDGAPTDRFKNELGNAAAFMARRSMTRSFDLFGDADSCGAHDGVQAVQAGELAFGGFDGSAGLLEKAAEDLTQASVDRLWADAEQGGDGDLRQGEVVVEERRQEPVGEGGLRAAPGGDVATSRTRPGQPSASWYRESLAHLNWALVTMMTRRPTCKSPRADWTRKHTVEGETRN